MNEHAGKLVLNGAPSQYSRLLASPDAARARVDGRTPAELRAFAVRVAALLNFYGLDDEPDGDWSAFFLSDPGMVEAALASAASPAAAKARAHRARRLAAAEEGGAGELLRAGHLAAGRDLAREAESWLGALRALPPSAAARRAERRLEAAIGRARATEPASLAEELAGLGSAAAGLAETTPAGMQDPQSALFDAFAELFGTAQATLDTLGPRYGDFYRREVLRETPRGALPDSVYLAFALAEEETAAARVPAGTLFPAGSDPNGREVLYAADRSLTVTTATLSRVRMLRAVRGPLVVPAPPLARDEAAPEPEPVVQRMVASHLAGEGAEAAGTELAGLGGWPTFGAAEVGTEGALVSVPAALGFAVASPELLLGGGRRAVALSIYFAPGAALTARLDEVAAAVGLEPWEALRRIAENAFALSVSTEAGWFALEGYRAAVEPPTPDGGDARLTLAFELGAAAPAVVPLYAGAEAPDDAPPEPNPAPALPTVRAYLRPGTVRVEGAAGAALVHPLPVLDAVAVRGVDVRTRVRGLPDVALSNTDGEVDPAVAFPVFGGTPAVGSFLDIRSTELFSKVPTDLRVTIGWTGLPPNADGFLGWYRDYVVGLDGTPEPNLFDNATFRGAWRVVSPGRWELRADGVPAEPVALFRARPETSPPALPEPCLEPEELPGGPLCPETRFRRMPVAATDRLPPYYDPAESALRLELTEPPYAFGNDLYAINVLDAVLAELPDAGGCRERCLAAAEPLAAAARTLALCTDAACVQGVRDALADAGLAAAAALVDACLQQPGGPTPACIQDAARALRGMHVDVIRVCMDDCMRPAGEMRYPNAPYLPQGRVSVDYSSGARVAPGTEGGGALFHLVPFGGWMPLGAEGEGDPLLLAHTAEAGSLLLGFEGMAAAGTLTLLFQMDQRSGVEPSAAEVEWAWLDGDRWRALDARAVPVDGTHGLENSGIVALELPRATARGTRLPGAGRWLRAAVASDADRFPWTVSLAPHALAATRSLSGGESPGLLPAGTITTSVQALPPVGEIVQPMPSFGGRPAETERAFAARLGERLRHKDRAVQPWDYERLVLERFPEVWMAQALPAGLAGVAPGSVRVVVVASEAGNASGDAAVPRAASALLGRIRDFLAARATAFASVQVVNPVYVRVQAVAEVAFRTGDAGGDADLLDRDLVAYLSPWFHSAERAATEGRYAFEADVAAFIRARPYVETLFSLELRHDPPVAALEWYFLTSAASHDITEPLAGGAR